MYRGHSIVHLLGKDKDAYTLPDQSWAREQHGRILCRTCYNRRLDLYPEPVDVRLRQISKGTSYDGVFQGGVGIMHERLRAFLEPYMRDYALGRCFWWKDGTHLPDYHSIYFRDSILVRGDRDSQYYICRTCRFIGVVADNPYVLRHELPDVPVFAERVDALYLGDDLARKLPWHRFSDLEPHLIPVRDEILVDDDLWAYERAIDVLSQAFDGDWPAAYAAVEQEARNIRMPDGPQTMGVVVRGIELIVYGCAASGIMRVGAFRTP